MLLPVRSPAGPWLSAMAIVSLLALGVAGCATGCSGGGGPDPAAERRVPAHVETISVDELDRLLANHDAQAVDANGADTRRRMGVIPGAVLLTDVDSIAQLPRDRATHLVFYCANDACGASHHAARKAILAGYTHVKVMPDGIAGWVKAGKKTSAI
ncbi:MAG TPA: rhodanese-like domain-containing protein [Kofleriaceae bacterium]|nr:rhodanese-like domain-containing protein [Kofleriaceae bacterium]